MKFCVRALFAVCFFLAQLIFGHGFVGNTSIHLANGKLVPIKSLIVPKVRKKCIFVESYNYNDHHLIAQRIIEVGKSCSPWCVRLGFDDNRNNDIICTPTQVFYCVEYKWVFAKDLCVGDKLVGWSNTLHKVVYKEVLRSPHNVYTFEVENTHTFFIGKQGILTHNMALPTSLLCEAGISMGGFGGVIGSLCSSPITIAIALIIGTGCAIAKVINRKKVRKYKVPIKDGFVPTKNWDGKKVKHSKNGKVGWPDKKGDIWVPTGPNGHGGPHWDVQKPDGKRYVNVYPGGTIRFGR
jgi:hypothetical protein